MQVERARRYPLAGRDAGKAEAYHELRKRLSQLSYADNDAARAYLDGKFSREQAIDWLIHVGLFPAEKAPQRTQLFDANRGYVINCTLGKDLVADYLQRRSQATATAEQSDARWAAFIELLSSPRLPSGVRLPPLAQTAAQNSHNGNR
ncbi:MAG: hypothetical protein ACOY3E_01810 [Pseudomonadota bacterium]